MGIYVLYAVLALVAGFGIQWLWNYWIKDRKLRLIPLIIPVGLAAFGVRILLEEGGFVQGVLLLAGLYWILLGLLFAAGSWLAYFIENRAKREE